ncbi:9743_t:CDS:2, partial [Acaulospora colombiana]
MKTIHKIRITASLGQINYPHVPYFRSHTVVPNLQHITTEYLDDIINSVLTNDERNKYESKLFLPLYDLIFPSSRPRRTTKRYQNSFIIFRKDYQARVIAECGPKIGSKLKEISQRASLMWGKCSPEDRYMYDQIAMCTKKLHNKLWPDHNVYKSTRKHNGHYGNYGYGEITKGCSAMFFKKQPNNFPSVNNDSSHCASRIPENQNFIQMFSEPTSNMTSNVNSRNDTIKSIERNLSMSQLKVNCLSSYDRLLVDSVNRN